MHLLFWGALAWSVAGLYFMTRGLWSAALPGDAGLSTGLEYCRQAIRQQIELQRRALVWSIGPVLLAVGGLILGLAMIPRGARGIFPNALPFLTFVVAWIAAYSFVRLRERRKLQRELQELNEIE
jgi:hypothetical protein